MNLSRLLTIAGVPATLHAQVIDCIDLADDQSSGLLWAKIKIRLFKASKIAKAMSWGNNRLIEARPDWADCDIAPMSNITANGDNGPWYGTPHGDRPIEAFWLNPDTESEEYAQAIAACYWCKGAHPRSEKARKAWYRRNGGEYLAWRLGLPIDAAIGFQKWQGSEGKTAVTVMRCGDAWIVKSTRKVIGRLQLKTRVGFEVDNVFSGPLTPQMWFPIEGHELRAPVTWSVLPGWEKQP